MSCGVNAVVNSLYKSSWRSIFEVSKHNFLKYCCLTTDLVERTGYESRQTSKWHVIVTVLAWSRDVKPAHTKKQDGVSSDMRGESRVVFPL